MPRSFASRFQIRTLTTRVVEYVRYHSNVWISVSPGYRASSPSSVAGRGAGRMYSPAYGRLASWASPLRSTGFRSQPKIRALAIPSPMVTVAGCSAHQPARRLGDVRKNSYRGGRLWGELLIETVLPGTDCHGGCSCSSKVDGGERSLLVPESRFTSVPRFRPPSATWLRDPNVETLPFSSASAARSAPPLGTVPEDGW